MELGPHPFTVRQLQYVVAVADARSFRGAAERCLVSQPSLSAQIADVELALGIRLFERNRRRVLVTPRGEILVARARRVLQALEDLRQAARELVDPLKGVLRFGVLPTIAAYLLPELDPAMRRAYPHLDLVWREDKTENLLQALENGELDGAILAREADLGDVELEVLGSDPFVLAMPAGHRLAGARRPVRPEELAGEKVLLLEDGHCFRNQALDLCTAAGTVELGFRATSLATLAQMVAGGAGITLLPKLAVAVESRGRDVAIREFARPEPRRTIVLAWRRGSALSASLMNVAAAARSAFPAGALPARRAATRSTSLAKNARTRRA